ncbi:MAG: hypothetical protein EXX96DRAFT_559696 [Benjaminiella poitrasii]|nr:MAG: hypothetical protein EXX96DRAFT_559696 [Benjaminiella poitrasii]
MLLTLMRFNARQTTLKHYRYYTTLEQRLKLWESETKQQVKTTHDLITESPSDLLAKTLNSETPQQMLPPCWHHIYFPPRHIESELASDGYESDFFPPKPFEQRLWAGARYCWSPQNPLQLGDKATMTTRLDRIDLRRQDSVAVWVHKDIENERGWSMREERCLIYRPSSPLHRDTSKGIYSLREPEFVKVMTPSSILLFRYSALTFNSHKIHFDHLYATKTEGHEGCLVHGPLSATLLMELLREQTKGFVETFEYRCLAPLYVDKPMALAGKKMSDGVYNLWINNHVGQLVVKGTAYVI